MTCESENCRNTIVTKGPKGNTGNNGWTPAFSIVADGDTREVLRLIAYFGGTGTTPTANIGKYLGPSGFVTAIGDGENIRGTDGSDGWIPQFVVVADGATREVLQLIAYYGGTGTTPTDNIGDYVSDSGFTSVIGDAENIRGTDGTQPILIATKAVTYTQMQNSFVTPLEIVPAAVGKLWEVITANVILGGGSTVFATNTTLRVFSDTANISQFELDCLSTPIGVNPSYKMTAQVPSGAAGDFQCISGKAIMVGAKTGDPTAGVNRTVTVRIAYRDIAV